MSELGFEMVRDVAKDGYASLQNWLDPWPSPYHAAAAISGDGGLGVDWGHFANMWQGWPIFIGCFLAGILFKKILFPRLGVMLGISARNHKKQRKFANQMWLFVFYSLNTYFGYLVQKDKPWFGFPLSKDNMAGFFHDFPSKPDPLMESYYFTGLAFYASEILSLFIETRRSDFFEYLAHHVATIVLISMSYAGRDHNMGSYVILIHDASDIFLCLAKSAHYVNWQMVVNASFAVFTTAFVFFRFVCLPSCIYHYFYVVPVMRKATINFFSLALLLTFVLQLLHVFWFALIVRTIYRLLTGVKGDARSESDKDEADAAQKRKLKKSA